jgi:hypothetical protein
LFAVEMASLSASGQARLVPGKSYPGCIVPSLLYQLVTIIVLFTFGVDWRILRFGLLTGSTRRRIFTTARQPH